MNDYGKKEEDKKSNEGKGVKWSYVHIKKIKIKKTGER